MITRLAGIMNNGAAMLAPIRPNQFFTGSSVADNQLGSSGWYDTIIIAAKQPDDLMPFGLSRRKAEYLIGIADEIQSGRLDLAALAEMGGEDVQKDIDCHP